METPSSMRRVTRSQTSIASQKSKQEEALSRSRNGGKQDRTVLLDITNDSPIVGLATGSLAVAEKTPSSNMGKNQGRARQTPGSGEALLRGQVKTLLQKVEEEAELGNKLSLGSRPPFSALLGFPISPAQLLAPTPANTPLLPNLSGIMEEETPMGMMMIPPFVAENEDDQKIYPQVVEELKLEEPKMEECVINRALLFDSPGKSQASDISPISSSLTYQESEASSCPAKSSEDDNSSAWSLQVNASIAEDEDGEVEDSFAEEDDAVDYEEEEEEDESVDDLCEGLLKMSVQEEKKLPEFAGKHTRFVYDSDDEIEGEEEVGMDCDAKKLPVSPNVTLLKGLPVPEGKHLRFQDEKEE